VTEARTAGVHVVVTPQDVAPSRDTATAEVESNVTALYQAAKSRVKSLAARYHEKLGPIGFGVLRFVFEHEPVRAGDVAAALGLDKSAVSRQITMLREMDLLDIEPDPADGRASLLLPSDKARQAQVTFRAESSGEYERILASWPTEDIATLARLLERFNDSIG
jgi:DNA-binding MarR family transcriptional regulator